LQALDLQQLFLAMTGDFRIIVVKLADRLHNMRTMSSMPHHKRCKIALETLRVFAPLANMLGLWRIKIELEDLSLQCASEDLV
jgi:(p)ppGpp synthase/HD superfamily hydrolase